MKILFATGRPFYPDLFGGAEKSMYQLLTGLAARGNRCEGVAIVGNEQQARALDLKRLVTARLGLSVRDERAGIELRRTRSWLLERVVRARLHKFKPDAVITQLGMAGEIAAWSAEQGTPSLLFIRDTQGVPFDQTTVRSGRTRFVANSRYTAGWASERFGIDASVVYPPIDISEFRVAADPRYVTFINPVKDKGLELALAIVRKLRDVPFLFVESWPLRAEELAALEASLAPLPNVTFWRRRLDVQSVYDVTKLLIIPSLWEEPFGRVVIEAQACGVPVIGRGVGGIAEAVGQGGVVVPAAADTIEWARVLNAMLRDRDAFDRLRALALENASGGPWAPNRVVNAAEELVRQVCAQ